MKFLTLFLSLTVLATGLPGIAGQRNRGDRGNRGGERGRGWGPRWGARGDPLFSGEPRESSPGKETGCQDLVRQAAMPACYSEPDAAGRPFSSACGGATYLAVDIVIAPTRNACHACRTEAQTRTGHCFPYLLATGSPFQID